VSRNISTTYDNNSRLTCHGWPVWHGGNDIGHVNKIKLRRARLVLGLVRTFGESTIGVFTMVFRPTQSGQPSVPLFWISGNLEMSGNSANVREKARSLGGKDGEFV